MAETIYFLGTVDTTRQSVELLASAMGYDICIDATESNLGERYQRDQAGCVVYNAVGKNLSDCLRWAGDLVEQIPVLRIIVICGRCETSQVVQAMRLGLSSILEFPFSFQEMEQSITNAILDNRRLLSETRNRLAPDIAGLLTRQEQEIAQMLLDGAGTKQISVKLDLSIRTIHYRKKEMFRKLGASGRGEALQALLSGTAAQQPATG